MDSDKLVQKINAELVAKEQKIKNLELENSKMKDSITELQLRYNQLAEQFVAACNTLHSRIDAQSLLIIELKERLDSR